jgi:hypothetical protein
MERPESSRIGHSVMKWRERNELFPAAEIMFRSRCPGSKETGAIGAQTQSRCIKGSRSFSLIRRSAERAYTQLGFLLGPALWIPQTCNSKETAMEHLDQNTWHRVHPDSLQASPSSQDDVSGFICPDSGMLPVSMREHVGLKGSGYADLRSLTAGQQICLLVLFLLSCIISCLLVGVI